MEPIETEHLILRDVQLEDAAAFSLYNEREEFSRYLTHLFTKEKTLEMVGDSMLDNAEQPRLYWYLAIVLKETNQVIGDIVLYTPKKYQHHVGSVGFGMNPDYWGRGLMTEALSAVTAFGHGELNLHRIETGADGENRGSIRVLEKCGYVHEGIKAYAVKTTQGWSAETFEYASVRPDMVVG